MNNNNKIIHFSFLTLLGLFFITCSKETTSSTPEVQTVEKSSFSNLYAPTISTPNPMGPPIEGGRFVKFSFADGDTTQSETEWDLAFRGTTILVNGGAATAKDEPARNGQGGVYIAESTFAEVTEVTVGNFKIDNSPEGKLAIPTGSGNGWYTYTRNATNPAEGGKITPIAGRIIVVRTHDGRYAKVEIVSYYKDAPNPLTLQAIQNDFRYYTFNYEYLPEEGSTSFE